MYTSNTKISCSKSIHTAPIHSAPIHSAPIHSVPTHCVSIHRASYQNCQNLYLPIFCFTVNVNKIGRHKTSHVHVSHHKLPSLVEVNCPFTRLTLVLTILFPSQLPVGQERNVRRKQLGSACQGCSTQRYSFRSCRYPESQKIVTV